MKKVGYGAMIVIMFGFLANGFAGQVEDRRLEEQIYTGERFPCRQLWGFLYISRNGDVMPCCMDVFKKLN